MAGRVRQGEAACCRRPEWREHLEGRAAARGDVLGFEEQCARIAFEFRACVTRGLFDRSLQCF